MTKSPEKAEAPFSMQPERLTPDEIATRDGTRGFRSCGLPERRYVFADRAARLGALAGGHPMAGYLEFIALVAEEQQRLLEQMPPIRLPSAGEIARCNEHGMPTAPFSDARARSAVARRIASHFARAR